ncbi:Arginase, catabolizes arginine to ornithine and urea [Haplosporangium sp. Z 767]|nr:Arginase, catabolizes arginine to ornithine and urea [Haplosporangium sp. Z 767]KAF9196149.1 Arginase, catabolizes arginine to ornithine and urea [Haplosporangium sp. Z 11]
MDPERLRISVPRQSKLSVQVPEIDTCVSEAISFESDNNSDSYSSPLSATKAYNRRFSWGPSQAIPEVHHSKGFTLTTFQKASDKAHSSSSSYSSGVSAATVVSSASSGSSTLRRSNTYNPQQKETLTPFRRLVGRSKSMKLKIPAPFNNFEATKAAAGATLIQNNMQDTTRPLLKKNGHIYMDISLDRNTPGDNNIQPQLQERTATSVNGISNCSGTRNETITVAERDSVVKRELPALPAPTVTTSSSVPKPSIATLCNGPCKPLWQHTRTSAEQIQELGLSSQEIQKQETIFELIYTESEYLDDLKSIHKVNNGQGAMTLMIFVEELNVKMAEARRKKRFSPDKADVKLYERLARLLSHIKDLWNGHQSLLRSLQNKQEQASPVVENIGSVFESFYMFSIYDSYFAQYSTTSRDFQQIITGNSELCIIIKDLLKSPRCKSLTLEGIFLKPIQRLQKYPLFFKDLMNLTSRSDPDYVQLEYALNNHQKELTKIDDRIWIEEHNEMLKDLQQRIKGLPSNISLVERHRYLILDGPVHRIAARQPTKFSFGKHSAQSKSESYSKGPMDWHEGFQSPASCVDTDDDTPTLIHRPSKLDYYHQHAKPAFPLASPPSSSSSSTSSLRSGSATPSSPFPKLTPRAKSYIDSHYDSQSRDYLSYASPSSPPSSSTTLYSLSSVPSLTPGSKSSSTSSPLFSTSKQQQQQPSVSQLVSQYNSYFASSFSNFTGAAGHPRNVSSSALYLPNVIKNSTDVEAEYHVFIFTDIILWTKRVMSRYHRKEGVPWNFKLVEPVSKLTSVCNTTEANPEQNVLKSLKSRPRVGEYQDTLKIIAFNLFDQVKGHSWDIKFLISPRLFLHEAYVGPTSWQVQEHLLCLPVTELVAGPVSAHPRQGSPTLILGGDHPITSGTAAETIPVHPNACLIWIDAHVVQYYQMIEMVTGRVSPNGFRPIHLSYDVDAIDSTVASSRGYPCMGGKTFQEGHYIGEVIPGAGCLAAMDPMEVNLPLGNEAVFQETK